MIYIYIYHKCSVCVVSIVYCIRCQISFVQEWLLIVGMFRFWVVRVTFKQFKYIYKQTRQKRKHWSLFLQPGCGEHWIWMLS